MSYELRVRVYGSIINLLISRIQKSQKEALLAYCQRKAKNLKRVWYFPNNDDQKFMKDLFHIGTLWSWNGIDTIFEINGPVFDDSNQIQAFLMDAVERPKIQEIYLDRQLKWDSSKIQCHHQKRIDLAQHKEDHFFVYYGFVDRLGLTYRFKTNSRVFHEENLSFHFTDCGEYGIILSKVLYEGNLPEISSRGSSAVYFLEVKFA